MDPKRCWPPPGWFGGGAMESAGAHDEEGFGADEEPAGAAAELVGSVGEDISRSLYGQGQETGRPTFSRNGLSLPTSRDSDTLVPKDRTALCYRLERLST